MIKKLTFLLILLLLIALILTGCSFAIPWANKATSTTSQPINNSENTTGASVATNSMAPALTINIPDQSTDKTIEIPGIIGKGQKIFVNDKEASVDDNGNFIATVNLVPGINQLTVKVYSKDGNSVYSTGKSVTYTPHIPKLIITNPIPKSYSSETSSITISGITDSNCTVTANGVSIQPDVNGNFIITVPLKNGENILKLESTNPSGLVNSIQQVINFTKIEKKPNPNLVVSLPDTGFVSSKDITINGFTDPKNIIEIYNNYSDPLNTVKSLIFKGSVNNGTFTIPVSLSDGPNTLLIRATNEFNISTDVTKTVNYKK